MDMNMVKLMEQFGTDDACREVLESLRWPKGITCPRCQGKKISHMYTRDQFDCDSCGYQFSVTSGTIFHDTHLPLRKWMIAIYLIVESKKGISANQIKRTIAVSYKTAWYLCHRIRAAMTEAQPKKLSGTVEVDETFIGGKKRGVGRGRGPAGKTVVGGIVERGGDVRLSMLPNTTKKTLHSFINQFADPKTREIFTDEWPAYKGIADHDTAHKTVNHHKKQWVHGKVHTNTIENVWSLLKRSIIGSYHKVSKKHLDAYLDELEWRYNNRKNPFLWDDTLRKLLGSDKLEYQDLITS
jgi:transposase-like protein